MFLGCKYNCSPLLTMSSPLSLPQWTANVLVYSVSRRSLRCWKFLQQLCSVWFCKLVMLVTFPFYPSSFQNNLSSFMFLTRHALGKNSLLNLASIVVPTKSIFFNAQDVQKPWSTLHFSGPKFWNQVSLSGNTLTFSSCIGYGGFLERFF